MTLSTRRKKINTALGLLLVVGLAYVFWPFVVGRTQMQRFCVALPPGSSPSQVKALAAAKGYELFGPTNGQASIHSSRSFGRFICDLRFGPNGLESAAAAVND